MDEPTIESRPSRVRRAIRYFDPAQSGFVRRMLRLVAMLALVGLCLLSLVGVVAAQSESGRYFVVFMLAHSDRYNLALPRAEALVRDFPTSNWHYYRIKAQSLRHLGRFEESLAVYDRAIEIMPDQWWAYSHRCFYGALLADPTLVMAACDRSIELSPDDPATAHDRRAIVRALVGDREGAIADLEETMRIWQQEGTGYSHRQQAARAKWLERLHAGEEPVITAEDIQDELAHY